MWRLLLLLLTATVHAQPIITPGHSGYEKCKEFPTPTGVLPPVGEQLVYCKQGGAGWCSMNSSGSETCTGGSGGGSGTVTSVTAGIGLNATPANPITGAGTINLQTPVAIANGGTNSGTQTGAFDNLSPLTTKGDLIGFNGTDDVRLGVGANNLCLVADSTQATGLKWASCSAGAGTVTSISQGTGMNFSVNPITSSGTINLATPVALANGGTGFNASGVVADEFFVGTGAGTVGLTTATPTCSSTSSILQYSTLAHTLGCTTTYPWASIAGGTNVNTLFVGTGGSLAPSGTGVINANQLQGTPVSGTAPTTGQIPISNGTPQWVPQSISGDSTLTSAGVMTNVGVNGHALPFNLLNTFEFNDVVAAPAVTDDIILGVSSKWTESPVPSCQLPGQALNYVTSGTGFRCQNSPVIRAEQYIDCTGATDATLGWAQMVAVVPATGSTIYMPPNCIARFASPGTTNPAATLPANTHLYCVDQSAGLAVNRQTCHGGTYPGASCNTTAECLGGGTCADDFGHTAANPCTATTCFAPTGASTYTLLKDTGNGSNDIFIENCSFFLAQASPYQACNVGGTPCRQECDNNTTAPNAPGMRCETNGDCNGGTCLRVADCHTGGGLCDAAPSKVPSGPGNIRAIDLTRTTRAQIYNVGAFDALTSDFTVDVGPFATLYNDNFAREGTDCTSPIPATPSNSSCFGGAGGTCCYGAAYATNGIAFGNKFNTQPTTAVTNQVITGNDAQLARIYARGTVAGSAISVGSRSHIEMSNVWPVQTASTGDNLGPGTPGGGYAMSDTSQMTKSYALNLGTSAVCLTMSGANSGAVGVKCNGASILKGAVMSGANSHFIGGNIRGLNATNAIGVDMDASNQATTDTYIEGNSTTGTGVNIGPLDNGIQVVGVTVSSNPNDTFSTGVTSGGFANGDVTVDSCVFLHLHDSAFHVGHDTADSFSNNKVQYSSIAMSSTYHPCGVLTDNGAQQLSIVGNQFLNGWRGVCQGTSTNPLLNTQIGNNRFVGLAGAPVALGGAGVNVAFNYMNNGAQSPNSFSNLVCDATCVGGSPVTRGNICFQDTDCTAGGNTCNGSVQKCIPEPVAGFIGSPQTAVGAQHPSWVGNLMFNGTAFSMKQCTVAGAIGQFCQVASCSGGVACSGSPVQTCASGADSGKACCQTAAGATCANRTQQPMIRIPDYGAASGAADFMFQSNTVFTTSLTTDWVGIDMQSSAALGNISLTSSKIANNLFQAASTTNTQAIKFPTSFTSIANVSVTDNHFDGWAAGASTGNIANYQGAMGSISLENGGALSSTFTGLTTAAQTIFFPIPGNSAGNTTETTAGIQSWATGAMTIWKMSCNIDAAPGGTSTRAFTLRKNAGNAALTCTIASGATTCVTTAGANSAPVSLAANDKYDLQQVSVLGTSLAAANGSCVFYASNDTNL